jgi:glycosyltransferase involved in cell wall biosynthesis
MEEKSILFITQKIHQEDDDLAFVIDWVDEMRAQGWNVLVICLEKRVFDDHFPVYSLGKEVGKGKLMRIARFFHYIFSLKYNRVFVHMNPEYFTIGGWYWFLRRIPMYLWYTHYAMSLHMWLAGKFCKRMFGATKQSMPQYASSPKRIITGHGIQVEKWIRHFSEGTRKPLQILLSVHRISRSKRLEIAIRALKFLPDSYELVHYGRVLEEDYAEEIRSLVEELHLEGRVQLMGPVPHHKLLDIYPQYQIMVNMAPETIDKTILEGMCFGLHPVTTKRNAEAIGLPYAPEEDTPESVAKYIQNIDRYTLPMYKLREIVQTHHSLEGLVKKMSSYMKPGI